MQELRQDFVNQKQIFTIPQDQPDPEEPEFCPNPDCKYHNPEKASSIRWFIKDGTHPNKQKGAISRFRCKSCGKSCSTRTFSIHYWTHREINLQELEEKVCSCAGQRQIARQLNASHNLVQNRVRRLARSYLNLYDKALHNFTFNENCAFDGFESFMRSQYFPDNINLLVGEESLAVYGISASIMRRKGKMTKKQKEYRTIIDSVWKPAPGALRKSCTLLFNDMKDAILGNRSSENPWTIFTDEHKAYPVALKAVPELKEALKNGLIKHETTNSKAPRTKENNLFPVNYLDRQLRKNGAEHGRKTVRFSREINMSIERAVILCGWNTFRKPYPIPATIDLEGSKKHADFAGLLDSPEAQKALGNLYTRRSFWSHQQSNMDWIRQIWMESYKNPPLIKVNKSTNEKGEDVIEIKTINLKSIPAKHLTA